MHAVSDLHPDDTRPAAETAHCDVLVAGSGAAGLMAALTAAHAGLSVIVAEKAARIGGTSARSGGWLWVPGNPQSRRAGHGGTSEEWHAYLRDVLGTLYHAPGVSDRLERYLSQAPAMLDFLEQETGVCFEPGSQSPDFHGESPWAATGWRSVVASPFDGRQLGPFRHQIADPIPEMTLLGLDLSPGRDLNAFLAATRSLPALIHSSRRLLRFGRDIVLHGRSTQYRNGHALVAALAAECRKRGVRFMCSSPLRAFVRDGSRIAGGVIQPASGTVAITARHAVILATGGFPHDPQRQGALFAHVRAGTSHCSAAAPTCTGDGLTLGETVGGIVDTSLAEPAAWAPVSRVPGRDGHMRPFPHLLERAKPGVIAVTRDGRRFVNEALPYHDVMRALFAVTHPGAPCEAWLVCDHPFIARYGLGAVKPFPFPRGGWLRNGYLKRGRTLDALACACGIDAKGLVETVEYYNDDAAYGRDTLFHRGGTPYQRALGDAMHRPNPCVAPIRRAPFYAVRIVPGSLGTFAGLKTGPSAEVLDTDGRPVPGLYAVGNDMAGIMRGAYPSGGITLGPAMTFGWLAARRIATLAGHTDTPVTTKETRHETL